MHIRHIYAVTQHKSGPVLPCGVLSDHLRHWCITAGEEYVSHTRTHVRTQSHQLSLVSDFLWPLISQEGRSVWSLCVSWVQLWVSLWPLWRLSFIPAALGFQSHSLGNRMLYTLYSMSLGIAQRIHIYILRITQVNTNRFTFFCEHTHILTKGRVGSL